LPSFERVLVANRGEIAIRVTRAATELGLQAIAIHSGDDAQALHVRRAAQAVALPGRGAGAYLDIEAVITAARLSGCQAVHPGYGFLSENAAFARRCAEEGLVFVGPDPATLDLFGDKAQARRFAAGCGVPTIAGLDEPVTLAQAEQFMASLVATDPDAAVIVKAIAGGGGRGIRIARTLASLPEAYERCRSEALAAAGSGELYIERYIPRARHIEVQVIGDGGQVAHLWERECTLQRQHQKLLEIAPSPHLPPALRDRLITHAVELAQQARFKGLGTVEFLVWAGAAGALDYAFIEVNPRVQVEHTVTEEVTGVDLVKAQLRIAAGATLQQLGLHKGAPLLAGFAIQARVNTERLQADGRTLPASGVLQLFEPPAGPGVRVDTCGAAGVRIGTSFDSLLAKVIVRSADADFGVALRRLRSALAEFQVEGVKTSLPVMRALLDRPELAGGQVHTRFIDEHAADLVAAAQPYDVQPQRPDAASTDDGTAFDDLQGPGTALRAPLQASVIALHVAEGDALAERSAVLVLEAMKMEHVIQLPASGRITRLDVALGQTVHEGQPLLWFEAGEVDGPAVAQEQAVDRHHIRADLQALLDRRRGTRDEARPAAVAKRRARGQRTARENVADLCDDASFVEYGTLTVAAQRARHPLEHLIQATPADGLVAGIGVVNGALFDGANNTRCAVLAYDATVLAGTQGREAYRKVLRMIEMAEQLKLPMVVYAEGGGARPGDTEKPGEHLTFNRFARLSGKVPTVGIAAGYAFAGNAALLGCCDVIIATETASFGMGGPAVVEGGGLGVYSADEIGPARMHYGIGNVDVLVRDEAEATDAARRYLGYFQGSIAPGTCPDQALLRSVIPEDRRRAYGMHDVLNLLADEGTVMELKGGFGRSLITALMRVQGHTVAVIANNPAQLGGAIDANAADKGARFLQLCDAFNLPILQLCDTPGVLVGPTAERTAILRHSSRMLLAGANLRTPAFTIVLRKAYGLGMVSMMGGAQKAPFFNIAWPTGEYGAMGVEGAVRLAYRKELDAVADPTERNALFEQRVDELYTAGKALNRATTFEFDEVIDPAESRAWILHAVLSTQALREANAREQRHAFVTPW
jgi:acetyl/propionyl-CoA carboxylase alpha subunit/acetyl-CoA carboxylase carboxyltransferase component